MGLEPRDLHNKSEFTEIWDALDLTSSVALNARQPAPSASRPSAAASAAAAAPGQGRDTAADAEGAAASDLPAVSAPTGDAGPPASEAGLSGAEAVAANTGSSNALEQAGASRAAEDLQADAAASAAPAATAEIATLQQILRTREGNLALVSDVDEQLLINVCFKQPIRLASFSIIASTPPAGFPTNSDEEDSVAAPMLVKVYCNKSAINFCGVFDEACAFSVQLTAEDVISGRRIALPGSKFHMCSSAQLFVQENQTGATYTYLNRLNFYGVAHKRYS
ncbi:hypothetical protein, conserved [Eimeria necatrix]|uniref:PITH domain-containing protein n=1 Tax=Eimeria necatrix TaxID=51315 RepID=U6MDL1_9EIME|nr:hypothetical protein, conserved [Eimeria necatrix]CDJ62342.1 hypothetical protein, conserved [Eimeria necatrix]